MNNLISFLLAIIVISLIIAGGFYTDATRRLSGVSGRKTNAKLKGAYELLLAASISTWLILSIVIISVSIYYARFRHFKKTGAIKHYTSGNGVIITVTISSFILMIMGILSVDAAEKIKKSGVSNNKGSYTQSLIGGVMALSIAFVCFVTSILAFSHKNKEGRELTSPPKKKDVDLNSLLNTKEGRDALIKALSEHQ